MKKRFFFLGLLGLLLSGQAHAQRYTDKLDRGIVAVPAGSGNLVSWRMYGEEYYATKYTLYRGNTKIAENLTVTNYQDAGGNASSEYSVEAFVNGKSMGRSAAVKAWAQNYLDVPLQAVKNRNGVTIVNSTTIRTSDGYEGDNGYVINDVSLADVNGDGVCEFIVKRNNKTGNLRNADNKTDFNLYECYTITGERLWWIDLGPNLMAGPDEQWDMIGYDWDCDGKAEVLMRGADNMIIHTKTKDIKVGNMNYFAPRDEYTHQGAEYLIYLNGETGEPYLGWDGGDTWTPMAFPLPRFEVGEAKDPLNATDAEYKAVWGDTDTGHRSLKIYLGAPYLDGRNPSIFLGRGCYTRHKFCALDVNKETHELTQRWRWNCYDSKSPWFGNGFHNYAIADVDMDGRDEIVFGSMIIDDTGFGLATTGLGHGDAQHCTDLDPYRWGLEQFTCQEGSEGNSFWNATTGQLYYRKADGGDDGRSLAGNFTDKYPGSQGRSVSSGAIGLSSDKIVEANGDAMSGSYSNLNMRIYWDGDLLDEIFNCPTGTAREPKVMKWGGSVIRGFGDDVITDNDSKCNPAAQGDILGDWREEMVLRRRDNTALRIFVTTYTTQYGIYSLWHDHVYRNGMAWQCVGYNQPPQTSFFVGETEGITVAPPPLILRNRTEVNNGGTINTTADHLLISGYENKTVSVAADASPFVLTVNAPAWVKGSGGTLSNDVITANANTPKSPARTVETYTTTLTGGAFSGATRLVKQGEGILILPSVVEKHTGNTDVWNGTLQFDGTFESSPLWLNRHTTLVTDGGKFNGGIKADYNANIIIGKEKKSTLETSKLELGIGARLSFDVFTDQSCDVVKADEVTLEFKGDDVWQQFGPKYKSPVFEIIANGGTLADGKYLLVETPKLTGELGEVVLEGTGSKRAVLSYEEGKIYLTLEELRPKASLLWNGTTEQPVWDFGTTKNFLNNGMADYSSLGDDVTFDDQAAQTTIRIKGSVRPGTVTFNNATKNYVLNGDSITGGCTLTKNGKGMLTINTNNTIGNTVINGGKLVAKMLANNTGQTYGSLGAVKSRITINNGATLGIVSSMVTDQPFSISGNATVETASGTAFTVNNAISGAQVTDTLTKTGTGTLTLGNVSNAANFGRLIVKAGRVNLQANNNVDQAPKTIEFQNGVVWGANREDTPAITNNTDFYVPKGKTGTFYGSFRGEYNGKLTGKGTFNVYSGGVRCYWNGDWSEFEGTIVPGLENRQNKKSYTPTIDFKNSKGLPKATLRLPKDFTFVNQFDMPLGNAAGEGTLGGTNKYIMGGQNDDFFFEVKCTAPVLKVGTGSMVLLTPGILTGALTVEEGTLAFDDVLATDLLTGTTGVTLTKKGQIKGIGYLSSVTATDEAQVSPVGYLIGTPGMLKVMGSMNMAETTTANFVLNSTSEYSNLNVNFLYFGKVHVTLGNGFQPKAGDSFTLWKAKRVMRDPVEISLPTLPEGLYWNTAGLLGKSTAGVLTVTDNPADGIGIIPADAEAKCQVFGVGGVMITTMNASRNQLLNALKAMRVKPGLYIVKMQLGSNQTTETVIVK